MRTIFTGYVLIACVCLIVIAYAGFYLILAERLRRGVEKAGDTESEKDFHVTVGIGVAALGGENDEIDALLKPRAAFSGGDPLLLAGEGACKYDALP